MRRSAPAIGGRLGLTLASLAAGAGAITGGCGDADDTRATAAPAAFPIEATAAGPRKALAFAPRVRAGLVTLTLTNSDSVPRSAQIVRIVGHHSVDEVLRIVGVPGARIPPWIRDGGGVGRVRPGASASATQLLAPGRYAIWDDQGGAKLGARGEFTVDGPRSRAALPAEPATLTATDDGNGRYAFAFHGLKAGTNGVRFQNTGSELHHAVLLPIRADATLGEVRAAYATRAPAGGRPPVDFAGAVGTAVIDRGVAQNISLQLDRGRYAIVCFISDRAGGRRHVAKGMLAELDVG